MCAEGPADSVVRPEWLFEVVNLVQGCAGPVRGFGDSSALDTFLQDCPPDSALEDELLRGLLEHVQTERHLSATVHASIVPHASWHSPLAPLAPTSRARHAARAAGDLLRHEPMAHWTLETLARRVGCNRTDLEDGFQQEWSYTFHLYLTICRVEGAKPLLRGTAWRLEEIAKAVGYRSKVSLHHAFHLIVGMTPDEYRRRWAPTVPSPYVVARLSTLLSLRS